MQRNKWCTHRISSPLYGSFAKETYNFKKPTNRSRPTHSICREISDVYAEHADEYICFTDTQSVRMYMFVLLHRVCGCICLFYYTEYADVYVCFTTESTRRNTLALQIHRICTWECDVLQCAALCCSVLQCVAVCCSALQCVAVCCSVLRMWCIRIQPIHRYADYTYNLYNLCIYI